jgi:hypothetical protein
LVVVVAGDADSSGSFSKAVIEMLESYEAFELQATMFLMTMHYYFRSFHSQRLLVVVVVLEGHSFESFDSLSWVEQLEAVVVVEGAVELELGAWVALASSDMAPFAENHSRNSAVDHSDDAVAAAAAVA